MLQNSGNVKDWDARIKAQADRHWDNYVKRRIDLSTARTDEPLMIAGEFLYVEDAYDEDTSIAQIKLNRNTNDALDLEKGVEIYTLFTQVFITNEALEDEWIDIVFGINFVYKKKIGDGFTNPITTAAGVDLVLLPGAGGITQIGDAGATSHGLSANDDLFVSGQLEVDGNSYFDGLVYLYVSVFVYSYFHKYGNWGSRRTLYHSSEELTIPVGQGAAGVATAANLCPASCTILAVSCRVSQAPGGGATTFDVGRTGGNLDEFCDGNGPGGAVGVALGTTTRWALNGDAAQVGPVFNRTANTITVTTDVNVAVSAMKLKINVIYAEEGAPTY